MKGVVADNSTPTTRIQTPPVTAPAEVTDKVAWVCHKDRDQVASSPNCIPRLRLIHRRIHLNLHRGTAVQGGRRNRKEGERRLETKSKRINRVADFTPGGCPARLP